jgi:hypothetical protein
VSPHRRQPLVRAALLVTALAPVFYFGVQPIAAAFHPGYDFVTQVASELGADGAPKAWILNTGAALAGLATLVGALAYPVALARLGAWRWLAGLVALALVLHAYGDINAAVFHLPDPRHNAGPVALAGIIAFPPLLLAALWRVAGVPALKIYLGLTLLGVAAIAPVMAGLTAIDPRQCAGLLQRVIAVLFILPVGIGAWCLRRRLGAAASRP